MKIPRLSAVLLIALLSSALSLVLCGVEFVSLLTAETYEQVIVSPQQFSASMEVSPASKHHQQQQQRQKQQQQQKKQHLIPVAVPPPLPKKTTSNKIRSGKETCPSQYQNENNKNEHSPLIFRTANLAICRSPKVGSNELRSIAEAYESDKPFRPPTYNRPYGGNILAKVKGAKAFSRYLYGNDVTRIMFVRHPVDRVLSAFLQSARSRPFWTLHGFTKNLGASPKTFRQWAMNKKLFYKYYHSECNENSTEMDLHSKIQHWAPPQHCRCGIYDCGVQWNVYKIEEHSIQSVLSEHLPQKYLPPANATEILHKMEYTKKDYLTDDILAFLNLVTREEQEYFGYEPLTVNDL